MDQDQSLSSENTIPSTPPPAIFSDDTKPTSPPSSPPGLFPWDYDDAPKNKPQPPQKSAFSLLGKRKALSAIDDNVRPTKKPAAPKKKAEDKDLTQMQISLGQKVQQRCKTCGMEYIISSTEDRKLHTKYHKQNTEGYEVGTRWGPTVSKDAISDGLQKGDQIVEVGWSANVTMQRKAQAVLDIVQRELGAVDIEIWDSKNSQVMDKGYRSYLYVRGTKCVGYLLVERIRKAWEVVAPDRPASETSKDGPSKPGTSENAISALKKRRQTAEAELRLAESSPIELSKSFTSASLGISRVWTSSSHRRQNIATALLDAALRDNEHYLKLLGRGSKGKGEVAFSQPTTGGARLARRWFGKTYGWKVYVD